MMDGLRVLLHGIVDYAGLFPPAALALDQTIANYWAYLASPNRWLLGRLIIPALRLEECAALIAQQPALPAAPWRISALLHTEHDLPLIAAFNKRYGPQLCVDTVEIMLAEPAAIARWGQQLDTDLTCYVEFPAGADPQPLVAALAGSGLRAKLRTGGTTAAAFPAPAKVVRFLMACVASRVPFKATAGLHHPLQGRYRLSYERDSPYGPMYGFLNLLLATAALQSGLGEAAAAAILGADHAPKLGRAGTEIVWQQWAWSGSALARLRESGMIAFGSCSFHEPLAELRQIFGGI